jgi:transposase
MADTLAMPWNTPTAMKLRHEFVQLAQHESAQVSELCRRFGSSRTVGYKWLERDEGGGEAALADQSRRPQTMPTLTSTEVTARIVALRQEHPAWGARKLRRRLADLGVSGLPAPSTFAHEYVALRPIATDGLYHVFFCHQPLGAIDLYAPPDPANLRYHSLLKIPKTDLPTFPQPQ